MHLTRFSSLIESIYSLCLDHGKLPQLLAQLLHEYQCDSVALQLIDRDFLQVASGVSPEPDSQQQQQYAGLFARMRDHLKAASPQRYGFRKPGELYLFTENSLTPLALPKDDRCKPLADGMLNLLFVEGPFFVQLIIQGENIRGDILCSEAGLLLGHIHKAFEIFDRIEKREIHATGLEALIDDLDLGAMLINSIGETVFCNRMAKGLLSGHNGAAMLASQLIGADASESLKLKQMIGRAVQESHNNSRHIEAMRIGDLAIVAVPLHTAFQTQLEASLNISATILISTFDHTARLNAEMLQMLYQLTPPEARLAAALCRGESIASYCDEAGITVHTARSYLKIVLQKTGTRRQGELIALLRNLPPVSYD